MIWLTVLTLLTWPTGQFPWLRFTKPKYPLRLETPTSVARDHVTQRKSYCNLGPICWNFEENFPQKKRWFLFGLWVDIHEILCFFSIYWLWKSGKARHDACGKTKWLKKYSLRFCVCVCFFFGWFTMGFSVKTSPEKQIHATSCNILQPLLIHNLAPWSHLKLISKQLVPNFGTASNAWRSNSAETGNQRRWDVRKGKSPCFVSQ